MNHWLAGAVSAFSLFASACASEVPAERGQSTQAENPLNFMFGEWVGTAKGVGPDRKPYKLTQTERVGPMLDGDATVIEGRGYTPSGDLIFNAFAIVSYDKRRETWEIRSYTDGHAGTFPFEPKENGYIWSTKAGPDAIMRYTATFDGDSWDQIGEYIPASGETRKIFEMSLKRIGDSNWPSSGIVLPPTE